jgi:RNase P/RNase MRP subunit p30
MSKRFFIDAWIRPATVSDAIDMVGLAGELGYRAVAVEGNDEVFKTAFKTATDSGLEVFRRKTIKVSTKDKLYEELAKHRWIYELISVESTEREVVMAALRDMRVDTVIMSHSSAPLIDRHIVSVASNFVEVVLSDLFEHGYEAFYRVLRLSTYLKKDRIRMIMTSGASDCLGVRAPMQLPSILLAMSVGPDRALKTVSGPIIELLRQNRAKLTGLLEPTGVWRIEKSQ